MLLDVAPTISTVDLKLLLICVGLKYSGFQRVGIIGWCPQTTGRCFYERNEFRVVVDRDQRGASAGHNGVDLGWNSGSGRSRHEGDKMERSIESIIFHHADFVDFDIAKFLGKRAAKK